jgi:hypothetical protein
VELYSAYLGAVELALIMYAVYVVVLDCGKRRAKMTDDSRLLTVPYRVVTDDVSADVLFIPPGAVQGANITSRSRLSSALEACACPLVLACADFLAEAYAAALGIADFVILNDPTALQCGPISPV